jgi:hypothetical protein
MFLTCVQLHAGYNLWHMFKRALCCFGALFHQLYACWYSLHSPLALLAYVGSDR